MTIETCDIYVVHDGTGRRKIGISRNMQARLKRFRAVGIPIILERRFTCNRNIVFWVERLAHQLLADKKLFGEWFDVSLEEAVLAIETAIPAVASGTIKPNLRSSRLQKSSLPSRRDVAYILTMQQKLIERIALGLGHRLVTIRKWRERGWVPHMHRFPIWECAIRLDGVTLNADDFDRFGYGWKRDSAA